MAKSKALTHQTNYVINCHIPDFVQTLSYVENGGLHMEL